MIDSNTGQQPNILALGVIHRETVSLYGHTGLDFNSSSLMCKLWASISSFVKLRWWRQLWKAFVKGCGTVLEPLVALASSSWLVPHPLPEFPCHFLQSFFPLLKNCFYPKGFQPWANRFLIPYSPRTNSPNLLTYPVSNILCTHRWVAFVAL